jgi:hypothetical protein
MPRVGHFSKAYLGTFRQAPKGGSVEYFYLTRFTIVFSISNHNNLRLEHFCSLN